MKHSLLGWSIERPNIHSPCYSMTGAMYVYINKPAKQHADASFTQVNDSLTGQLYFPSPVVKVWGNAPIRRIGDRENRTLAYWGPQ